MALKGVMIKFNASTERARENILDLAGSFRKLERAQDGANDSGGKLKGMMSGALKSGIAGVGVAAAGAAVAMIEFGKEAMEDAKQAKQLEIALSKLPGVTADVVAGVEDWIGGMELATHVGDDVLRTAMGRLAQTTGDVASAQEWVQRALDASAGSGRDFETVSEAMRKAAGGNLNALKKLYPQLDANKDGTLTLKEATEGLDKSFKGAAKAAGDTDPWGKIQVIWGNLKEALGQWVLPLLEELGEWFKSPQNQQKIRDYIQKVADFSREMGVKLKDAIKAVIDWLKSPAAQKAWDDFKTTMRNIKDAAQWVSDKIGGIRTVLSLSFKLTGLEAVWKTLQFILDAARKAKEWIDKLRGVKPTNPYVPVPGYGSGGYNPALGPRPKGASYVINVSGAIDPPSVAAQIDGLLSRRMSRLGPAVMSY